MRAIAILEFGGVDKMETLDLPRPRPSKGEVLIRVVAAGVNPVDALIRSGKFSEIMPHAFPLIPGWDAAGVVEEFGEGVTGFRKGDRVWACAQKPVVQGGTYAEYVSVPESGLSKMPAKLLFEEAAAIPCAALTAYQCLFSEPGIGTGSTVLVHAAAGGVGHFALQLARNAGAKVLGTAGSTNQEFILGQGASVAIDYSREDFVEVARRHCPEGVDLVIDSVGGDAQTRSLDIVKPGGRLACLTSEPDSALAAESGKKAHMLQVVPDAEQLALLSQLVDHKRLAPHVQKIYSLKNAAEAHTAIEGGHVRGKLVLNL
jgi:NADPH:quinone reductase-like Zn-dependent oxidoreductase